ncbi:MAG: hypothetical protein NTW10_04120 [Bacteroidetes bacterium]|nr:hypothetical protein [Bacteroidota bacterium]
MRKTIYTRLTGIALLGVFFCGCSVIVTAQGTVIKNGTTLKVTSGTTVVETIQMKLESGSALDNSGTIILKGNLVNQNGSQTNLGTGTFQFSGTSKQYISGQNLFNNVELNNSKGLNLTGNTQVNGTLTLTNGLITLGTSNLLLGPTASVAGTPSSSKMILASGTGELRKTWSANGLFTFPVGDSVNATTIEYSPVGITFTSGTYPAGNYIGVSLKNQAYNTGIYTGSYLNRYWVLTNTSASPITGFSADATFKYLDGDITGTESEIYCTKVAPDPVVTYAATDAPTNTLTAAALTSFSTFTGTKGGLVTSLTAFLEGPYNNGTMYTDLNDLGFIPLTQPYSGDPWYYTGTENVTSIPAGVVDWVLIDLRQAGSPGSATSGTSIAKRAAFLKSDGSIVDLNGSNVKFYNFAVTNNLYPVIIHRNHIPIMSNNAVPRTNGVYLYDYSTSQNKIYDGNGFGCIQLGTKWGMVAADADGDGGVFNSDLNIWRVDFGAVGYDRADFNLDGNVSNADRNIWRINFGSISLVP